MKCKELKALAELLQKQCTALSNQRHSMAKSNTASVLVKEIIDNQLTDLKAEIKRIYQRMEELISEEDQQLITNLCSIPGIGKKTAMLLFICTNGFKDFENSKQLALIAICNKLLKQSFAIAQSGIPYDENFKSVKKH